MNQFDKSKSGAILGVIGRGNLMSVAAVATVNGDNFQNFSNTDSLYNFESAGRALLHGVTTYTFSTPAGSFFVPTVESWEKSRKDLYVGGLSHATQFAPSGTEICSPELSYLQPPCLGDLRPQFRM